MIKPIQPVRLEAKHLKKYYKKREAVKDISFYVGHEIVGLLGPNGAGKTTSFYMVVGLISPDDGQIFLNGTAITNLAMHERALAGISYLPQEPSVFRKLSVSDNIMAILELRKNLDRETRVSILEQLLHEFHLTHLRDNIGISLSGGERRRVEIARALAAEPKLLLLDEPAAGLNIYETKELSALIKKINKLGITILLVEHDMSLVMDISDEIVVLNYGEVIADDMPENIQKNKKVIEVYLGE